MSEAAAGPRVARWIAAATGALCGLTTAGAALARDPAPAPVVEESANERRAVRGVPLDDTAYLESPELREVRRFDELAFPRRGTAPEQQDDAGLTLPPGLEGRWGGTGDLPAVLRSPEVGRRAGRAAAVPESAWLRSLSLPDLPVRWEPSVVRYLDYFKSDPKGRSIMASWLRKMGRFRTLFQATLEREGLPKDIVFLAMIESGFEPGAVSSVGAGGLWQFMPGVARAYGLEVSYWVDARRDPERAVEAAARYLKDLHVRFGSWHLAFAAYHAGYGAILASIGRYNTNDYWELCKHEAGLPWETTLYVPKILAAAIVGHNPAAFGFTEVTPEPPLAFERLAAPAGVTLATLAKALDVAPETLQSLNPELIRGRVPPDRAGMSVRVPVGKGQLGPEAIATARGPGDRVETLVLRFGESLDEIARSRGISVRDLRKLNGVRDNADLRGGTVIVVPARGEAAEATRTEATSPPADDEILVPLPDRAFSYEGRERVFYRTRDGDTLEEVAGVFQVSADELADWNNLDPDAKLQPRLVLQVFVDKDFDRRDVALLDADRVKVVTLGSPEFLELQAAKRGKTRLQYVARAGDTLTRIARRYGLYPGDLARINKLSAQAELQPGQNVIVYSPTPEMPRELAVGRSSPHRRPAEPATSRRGKNTAKSTPAKRAAAKPAPARKPAAPAKTTGKR